MFVMQYLGEQIIGFHKHFFRFYYNRHRLRQIDNCDAGAAKLHVLIAIRFHTGVCVEEFADILAQYAVACSVQYSHARDTELCGIVKKIGYCLQRLVNLHATHIDIG